jgi:anaerobic selenocysteine-containing dehydrogenase
MKVRTTCNRDCPDACGLLATVEDGRITKLQGDPDHPVTQGFLCYRTSRFLERQYDPARLTSPLLRRNGGFEKISWDDALDRIAESMLRIREESGGAAIMQYKSGGSMGLTKHITEYLFERFGPVTVKSGDICSGAGEAAQEADFGESESHDFFDALNSRTIVLWGKNPYVSNLHLLPLLRQAKANGTRLIQIDPVHHRGADLCDLYLQPRPGGDLALALGVIRSLFEGGHVDPDAASYCDNLDALKETCLAQSTAQWCELAGVGPEEVGRLTETYADGPSAIFVGWGMQRRTYGTAAVRLLDAIAAISGNLGVPGGGSSFFYKRRGAFDLSFMKGLAGAPRAIPEPLIGPAILETRDPEIRMVWVHNGNPVSALPESATVARALESRELTVVVDSFLTDSAACAHIVLPITTMLEDDDLVGAFGHHWLGDVRQVVTPPDGVKTDYEIVQALAPRLGLGAAFSESIRDWKRRLLNKVEPHGVSLEALERGPMRNPLASDVLFEDRNFNTPTGNVQLIHEVDATPPRVDADRPLFLAAIATEKAQASQWPSRKQEGPADVTVHPEAANGFSEGQLVRIESETGSLEVRLRFDARQRRDMALMEKGGWFGRGRCANVLVPARTTDAGGGAVYYDTSVRLLPLD